ncbi:YeiH family putative sulfate export transporter [Lonepinella sp. MS14437]|uniref:YeiH family putative sulfate export transporter n=1 Tax=unclassified Lonepinella TaxID=2642006 RepID=UPI0036DDD747
MKKSLFGLAIVGIITFIAKVLSFSSIANHLHFGALTLAILAGLLIGNTLYPRWQAKAHDGVTFAKGKLLRIGIVLYGFHITFQDIAQVGINAIISDAIMLIFTFFITCALGIYLLKIDKQIVYLTAAGCSICGAAAILATEPVVKTDSHKVSVAIALIVIFGTISMFIYPVFYDYMQGLTDNQFGIYIGSSIHEVAQVYTAGKNINPEVANVSVITKMLRVMMLAPFLIFLSLYLHKQQNETGEKSKFNMPWFALYFILVAVFNSFQLLPEPLVQILIQIDGILLMMSMTALGLTTHISAIKQAGVKPLILGFLVFLWLVIGGFVVNFAMQNLFA